MIVKPSNGRLLESLRPFVVVTQENRSFFNPMPLGLEISESDWFDPLFLRSAPFLEQLKRLDEVTFGPEGMPMPRWVFIMGGYLSGGIVGFGCPVDRIGAIETPFPTEIIDQCFAKEFSFAIRAGST